MSTSENELTARAREVLADERSAAYLVMRGLRPDVAADVVALQRVRADGLFAEHVPGRAAPWVVGGVPREYATEGEGDSVAEALAQHRRLLSGVQS